MALGIPLPGSFGDALSKGLATGSDVMQRMVMNPYDMQLKQAQVAKDRAEAQKAEMLSNLMQSFLSGDNSGGGVGGGKSAADKRAMMGWMLGLGEMPQDKRAAELANQKDIKKFELDTKKQQDVLDSAYVLKNSYGQLKRVQDIFKNRPDLTGPVQGFLYDWHLSNDKDLGKVIADFGKIQAGLAKSSTARPGIGAINWAAKVKANERDPMSVNVGKIEETIADMREEYDTYRKQYKDATGQNMPTFEEFMGEQEAQNQGGAPAMPPPPPNAMPPQQAPQQPPQQPPQMAPQAPPQAQGQPQDQVQKALGMMPPKLRQMAIEAIQQGADPQAVLQEAMKLLNPGAGQR